MFPKAPVGIVKAGGPNRITIRKMSDAERKQLTESIEELSPVNIL